MHRIHHPDKFSSSGVYKLTCPDYKKAYVGQTDCNFEVRYNEPKHAFRTNRRPSRFAQHLNKHTHSPDTIENTMQILYHHRKGTHVNTIERYYIHAEHTANSHLTLRLLMSYIYIYGAPSKDRNFNVVYISTYVWQRWKPSLCICCKIFQHCTLQSGFLCINCV